MTTINDSLEIETPVAMIAALAANRAIGVGNRLPWYLPADLKHFKRMTQGKPLIMGRKTFESIGRALPGRLNVVVTRDARYLDHDQGRKKGIRVCHSLASALRLADSQALIDGADEIMVMGGGEIYSLALPIADRLYLTEVSIDVDGDAYFPTFEDSEWREIERIDGEAHAGEPAYAFVQYRRTPSFG